MTKREITMSADTRLTTLEATVTFADGKSAKILVGDEVDSAWGNTVPVLGRTVDIREAIVDALRERELFATESEKDTCDECGESATEFWPRLNPPVQLCTSCLHDATRSGWEPGQ